jgi:hypothetical protein
LICPVDCDGVKHRMAGVGTEETRQPFNPIQNDARVPEQLWVRDYS